MWNLKLDLGEHSFDKEAFGTEGKKNEEASVKPSQGTFWEAFDAAREEDLHVTMKKVGKVLRFEVSIEKRA